MENLTFEKVPQAISEILAKIERIEALAFIKDNSPQQLPKFVDINGAAVITSKSPNALRIQISLGNLKSVKRGSRHYFDREYLENWLSGNQEDRI
jgi:hypothetical protein